MLNQADRAYVLLLNKAHHIYESGHNNQVCFSSLTQPNYRANLRAIYGPVLRLSDNKILYGIKYLILVMLDV